MSRSIFVLVLAMLACGPAFSAEHGRHVLPPERHAIESACAAWNAGERMTL
jgi:hypothetical protein